MKALVVIDMQRALFEKKQRIFNETQLIDNVNSLIRKADIAHASVYVVQHCNDSFLRESTEAWRVHDALEIPKEHTRVLKHHGSCFEDTHLEDHLRENNETEIVLVGLVTNGCIRASCLDGLKRRYMVTLAADGHSSYSRDAKQIVEEWNQKLQAAGANLRTAKEISFP